MTDGDRPLSGVKYLPAEYYTRFFSDDAKHRKPSPSRSFPTRQCLFLHLFKYAVSSRWKLRRAYSPSSLGNPIPSRSHSPPSTSPLAHPPIHPKKFLWPFPLGSLPRDCNTAKREGSPNFVHGLMFSSKKCMGATRMGKGGASRWGRALRI